MNPRPCENDFHSFDSKFIVGIECESAFSNFRRTFQTLECCLPAFCFCNDLGNPQLKVFWSWRKSKRKMPQAYLLKSVMKVVRGADASCIVSAKILMSCLICETLLYLLVVPECHPPPVVHGFDAVIEFCKIYGYSDFTIRFWDGMAFSICAITLSTSAN